MRHDIQDLALFEKLATISRENSVYEILWHLDIEPRSDKTVINVLFRNVINCELVVDAIAPEYIGYCSVGSFFKGGKKIEVRPPTGLIRDILIDVPGTVSFHDIRSVISDTEYNLNFIHKTKNGISNYSHLCKKQQCMVFWNGANKIVIPCSVIAATYYLISTSMRIQLFAQNLPGLYEAVRYDPSTETAHIILNRNARTEDVTHIARFAISPHARHCWDNVMNGVRSSTYKSHNGTEYSSLVASIPVIQQNLVLKVRCHEAPNPQGGITTLVHEIVQEWSDPPFKALRLSRRENAPKASDPLVKTELDTNSNDRLTNTPPSNAYKGHQVKQFNVPDNPHFKDLEFIEVTLPSRYNSSEIITVTGHSDDIVSLSSQKPKGNDPANRVAPASLNQEPPKKNPTPRMALIEFRELAAGLESMEEVTNFYVSSDLQVPIRDNRRRNKLTLRESYNGKSWHRRHYIYATFRYRGKFACLIEINQEGLSTRIGTFVLVAAYPLEATDAQNAAKYFVQELDIGDMKLKWKQKGANFTTKSHPTKKVLELWESWRTRVLEMVSEI